MVNNKKGAFNFKLKIDTEMNKVLRFFVNSNISNIIGKREKAKGERIKCYGRVTNYGLPMISDEQNC